MSGNKAFSFAFPVLVQKTGFRARAASVPQLNCGLPKGLADSRALPNSYASGSQINC